MNVSLIGTNGFLSNEISKYFISKGVEVHAYGLKPSILYKHTTFKSINLEEELIDVKELLKSDVIVYTSGAGIQSNIKESWKLVYKLNTIVPIEINCLLEEYGFEGTFVTFGSYFEIGNNNKNMKFSELDVCVSQNEIPNSYCLSKRLLTRYVNSKQNIFNHLHIILPTIYGYGEASHRIIPYTVNSIKKKVAVEFTIGDQIRQYLYVGDMPEILIQLIKLKAKGVINISGNEVYSISELVSKIYEYFGSSLDNSLFGKVSREDTGMKNLQLDGRFLHSILPNIHYTSLQDALKEYC